MSVFGVVHFHPLQLDVLRMGHQHSSGLVAVVVQVAALDGNVLVSVALLVVFAGRPHLNHVAAALRCLQLHPGKIERRVAVDAQMVAQPIRTLFNLDCVFVLRRGLFASLVELLLNDLIGVGALLGLNGNNRVGVAPAPTKHTASAATAKHFPSIARMPAPFILSISCVIVARLTRSEKELTRSFSVKFS